MRVAALVSTFGALQLLCKNPNIFDVVALVTILSDFCTCFLPHDLSFFSFTSHSSSFRFSEEEILEYSILVLIIPK